MVVHPLDPTLVPWLGIPGYGWSFSEVVRTFECQWLEDTVTSEPQGTLGGWKDHSLANVYLLCGAGLQEGLRVSPRINFPAYTCRTQLLGAGRWAEQEWPETHLRWRWLENVATERGQRPRGHSPEILQLCYLASSYSFIHSCPNGQSSHQRCPPRLSFLHRSLSYWRLWHTNLLGSALVVWRDGNRRAGREWPRSISRGTSRFTQAWGTIWHTVLTPCVMCSCLVAERHVDTEHCLSPRNAVLT